MSSYRAVESEHPYDHVLEVLTSHVPTLEEAASLAFANDIHPSFWAGYCAGLYPTIGEDLSSQLVLAFLRGSLERRDSIGSDYSEHLDRMEEDTMRILEDGDAS